MSRIFQGGQYPSEAQADFILAEAEKRLHAQTTLLLASDVRSLGLLASSIALAAAAMAFVSVAVVQKPMNLPWICSSITILYNSIRAIYNSIQALKPIDFKPSGWTPRDFEKDIQKGKTLLAIKIEIIELLEDRLSTNRTAKQALDDYSQRALNQLGYAPVVSMIVFLLAVISLKLAELP